MATGGTEQRVDGLGAGSMQLVSALTQVTSAGVAGLAMGVIETGLTAHAGGGQGSALALTASKSVSVVTTVGSAADSVSLPLATGSGITRVVANAAAANSMQLFGAGTDTINGVATATGIAIAAGKSALCTDYASGKWIANVG